MSTNLNTGKLPWSGFGRVFVAITVLVGCAYAIAQWLEVAQVEDSIFIGLLSANTFLIYKLTKNLRIQIERSAKLYEKELESKPIKFSADQFSRDIFGWNPALFVGLAFGSIFFVTAYNLSPWDGRNGLDLLLCSFLMSANVVTGMALSSLFYYFRHAYCVGSNINIELWDRDRPSIAAIVSTNRNIVLVTAFISSIGVTSILFSKFDLSVPVFVFSAFALGILFLTYTVPLIPLTAQIRRKKASNINRIARLIEREYESLNSPASGQTHRLDTSRFDSLNTLYRSVKSVREFPPVGAFLKNTALSVIFLTLFPSVIQFILDRII